MIHYTCDRCKRVIDSAEELRYVVKLEIQAAMDVEAVDESEDDRDHLLEIHEILERADDLEDEAIGSEICNRSRFDLCCECYRKFMRNPVGMEPATQLNFSQN